MKSNKIPTEGFIDGATITSALTYLNLGRNASHPAWHQQSILEATYLMLHDNIHIIPRPKGLGGEHGDYAIVADDFPELIVDSDKRRLVVNSTFEEADQKLDEIKSAWDGSWKDENFQIWADVQRRDRWPNQSLTYGALFDVQSIPIISKVSGYDMGLVRKIYERSADPTTVEQWARAIHFGEEAQIANAGWIIGGFVRGFFYENLAATEGLQLLSHPFRLTASLDVGYEDQHEFTNSELALVKILIANALTEPTSQRRVQMWSKTVRRARDYINVYDPDLSNTTQPKAEEAAISIAKRIELLGGPQYLRTTIDVGLQAGITTIGFKLFPWAVVEIGLATRGAQSLYKMARGRTPGEDLGDLYFKSTFRFRWLARSVPGRIERTLRASETDHL